MTSESKGCWAVLLVDSERNELQMAFSLKISLRTFQRSLNKMNNVRFIGSEKRDRWEILEEPETMNNITSMSPQNLLLYARSHPNFHSFTTAWIVRFPLYSLIVG